MKSLKTLALAACLIPVTAAQAATYSFDGYYSQTASGQGYGSMSFRFTLDSPITSDITLQAAEMTSCTTEIYACTQATFYVDASDAGLAYGRHDWQAIAFQTGPTTSYYYFGAPAFVSDGSHATVDGAGPATLTVSSVPEPTALAMMGIGLPLLVAVTRARRRRIGQLADPGL